MPGPAKSPRSSRHPVREAPPKRPGSRKAKTPQPAPSISDGPAPSDLAALARDLEALENHARYDRLGGYDPYPFQRRYHCREARNGGIAYQMLLMAGNQVGKSEAGGADVAIHATGRYPAWWEGPDLTETLRKHPRIWCGGANNDRVRDIAQAQLAGDPADPEAWGTGWIPRESIVDKLRKPGVPNALESVTVKHRAGFNVTISFKAYEAGVLDWAGQPVTLIWLDEEPTQAIYSQAVARTIASGGRIGMTFTPEKGATLVVQRFMTALGEGQELIQAGWDDAKHEDGRTHLDDSRREQLLAAFLPHEREMRSKGIPVLGSGMVFTVPEEQWVCEPFEIPAHWARIRGLDFGSGGVNHPTAAAEWAIDREAGIAYLYRDYRSRATEYAVHAANLKGSDDAWKWIPCAWPHDGNRKGDDAGNSIAGIYRSLGLNMLSAHFQNPEGGNKIEPGIAALVHGMERGTVKVFTSCHVFREETRLYHRDDAGQIVPLSDDVISAARVGYQSRGYARVEPTLGDLQRRLREQVAPGTNDYNPLEA